jgi:hypothetical protein
MQFYELREPDYSTDQLHDRANPIRMIEEYSVPGILCPVCTEETGGGWASSDRVRVDTPDDTLLKPMLSGQNLPPAEWKKVRDKIRIELNVPAYMRITPGAAIGLPRAELLQPDVQQILHPFPGQLIVRDTVVHALEQARLTGFQPVPVSAEWGMKAQRLVAEDPPLLYELCISGHAWRVGFDEERITTCHTCGRKLFPDPHWLEVDQNRWDGSDFFTVDMNPNIVLVTDRVCQTLADAVFGNYRCVPIVTS